MATQTVTFGYTTGQTLTLKLGALASDTIVDTASATERSNQTGIYAASFTDVAAGVYRAIAYSGASPVVEGFVELTAATAVFSVEADNPTDRTTILNRIGAFTGTGVNTILGFFKAIMFSDATEPSDAGDTFDASLEEVKAAANAGVAGGSTTTISLGVASMRWWITTDSAGNTVIASGTTQEAGTAQALLIEGNTYYMWARKIGYNDLIAYSFVAVAD